MGRLMYLISPFFVAADRACGHRHSRRDGVSAHQKARRLKKRMTENHNKAAYIACKPL